MARSSKLESGFQDRLIKDVHDEEQRREGSVRGGEVACRAGEQTQRRHGDEHRANHRH